jgi:hypothetical protein
MTLRTRYIIVAFSALLAMGAPPAQEITPTPGTYELLEGKSMQFDARQKEAKVSADRCEWQIVHGEGGRLLNADSARVTFVAPSTLEEATRNFTLQLTTHYPKGNKPSQAQINIRVHKKTEKVVARDRSPWLHGTIGFGFGYLWGGWWPYPPLIVIPPPPPGEVLPPEEVPPVAVPLPEDPSFDTWAENNPDIADDYFVDDGPSVQPADEVPVDEALPVTGDAAIEPSVEPIPEVSIEPAPAPEGPGTMDSMDSMDTMDATMGTPMDMPMETPDIDVGGFD